MEYMEDMIEKDPMAAYPPGRDDIPLLTGDKLIDAWEKDLAAGKELDIAGDLGGDPAVQAWLKGSSKKKVDVPTEPPLDLEFSDDFTGGFDGKP